METKRNILLCTGKNEIGVDASQFLMMMFLLFSNLETEKELLKVSEPDMKSSK